MDEFPYFFARYGDKEARAEVVRNATVIDRYEAILILRAEDDGAVLGEPLKNEVLNRLQEAPAVG